LGQLGAFSSEVDTGSREENASNEKVEPARRAHFFSTMQLEFLGQLALRRADAAR
jgi:hypothetical protein